MVDATLSYIDGMVRSSPHRDLYLCIHPLMHHGTKPDSFRFSRYEADRPRLRNPVSHQLHASPAWANVWRPKIASPALLVAVERDNRRVSSKSHSGGGILHVVVVSLAVAEGSIPGGMLPLQRV